MAAEQLEGAAASTMKIAAADVDATFRTCKGCILHAISAACGPLARARVYANVMELMR